MAMPSCDAYPIKEDLELIRIGVLHNDEYYLSFLA